MKKFLGSIICLGILAFGFYAFTTFSTEKANVVDEVLAVGDLAPGFTLKNAQNDQMDSLDDLLGTKGGIVIFSCNTCPVVVAYEDRMNDLHAKYKNEYPVIAINPNDADIKPGDSYDKMKERIQSKGFEFAYLYDEDQTVFPQYNAKATPHVYLVDINKKVRYIGAIDNSRSASGVSVKYLENAIEAVDQGNDPDPASTKAVGCSIKVKRT